MICIYLVRNYFVVYIIAVEGPTVILVLNELSRHIPSLNKASLSLSLFRVFEGVDFENCVFECQ